MMGKKRAVGEIIAAMVLLLIVSISGGILFSVATKEGNQQSTELKEELSAKEDIVQERFKIVNIGPYIDPNNPSEPTGDESLSIWILNFGDVDIIIDRIYVNDISYGPGDYQTELVNPGSHAGSTYAFDTNFDIYLMDVKKFVFNGLSFNNACQDPGKIVITSKRGVSVYGKCG
jgi:archaellum component FlaG (FlaF/FlaG flagellin family)